MSVDHEGQNSPRRETYLNGSIDDSTDCIDFTNQYQKSCSIAENNPESDLPKTEKGYCVSDGKPNESERLGQDSKAEKKASKSIEQGFGNISEGGTEGRSEDNLKRRFESRFEGSFTDNFERCFERTFEESFPAGMSSSRLSPIQFESSAQSMESEGQIMEIDARTMEPDVTITVGKSTFMKPLTQKTNKVTKGSEVLGKQVSGDGVNSKVVKEKSVCGKKNYLKLPVNKNIKKKAPVVKHKSGNNIKQKSEPQQNQSSQSNIKFKCYKCSLSTFASINELQSHQRKCNVTIPEFQSSNETTSDTTTPSNPPSNPSNVKITRKVYLCSACGSYYENWNLFLHMKEMHRRHICLFCLGMFSQTDKLAQHLITKHKVVEQNLSTTDDFYRLYKGTCYLICCSCEGMFSEQEEFYEHSCKVIPRDPNCCPLCGIHGGHHPSCRHFQMYRDQLSEVKPVKPHSTLEKRLYNKKKKLKANTNSKTVFKVVQNEKGGEMLMTVKKQTPVDEKVGSGRGNKCSKKYAKDTSPTRLSIDDLVSTKQFNEKMLQLYRPNRSSEKVTSSLQSIEDSINRVVENLGCNEGGEEEVGENLKESIVQETGNVTPGSVGIDNTKPEVKTMCKGKKGETPPPGEKSPCQSGRGGKRGRGRKPSAKNEKEELPDAGNTDAEKVTMTVDQSNEAAKDQNENVENEENSEKPEEIIIAAGPDIPYIHITLKADYADEKDLIKELVKESSWNCVYCAHAKRIAVNGKQLSLHILAEHRFVTCPEEASEEVKSNSASNIVERLKSNLLRLQQCYFNTDTFDSEDRSIWKPSDKLYECFHCLFATYIHKELYSHNRKMHQKAVFLCIMCKSNFYNYSELLCHLCPGIYVPGQVINPDITYRCFLCNVDPLPSSFRLMVHLRRRHNSCDICFDQSSNQFQLSTHVWKHKISHMCYRCGIAYRNKPDITKHLFWKHGTESVLCKKCLQKKWPHVYHFCVPPNSFICDECSFTFKSAVALKVHKRLHTGEYPYSCDKCDEKFISRKLLEKHKDDHGRAQVQGEAEPLPEVEDKEEVPADDAKEEFAELNGVDVESDKKQEKEKKSKKRKVITDVFDLPPVNLSESDDSDQEVASGPKIMRQNTPELEESSISNGFLNGESQREDPVCTQIVDGVWNNFQNYMDRKEFPKSFRPTSPFKNMSFSRIKAIMLSDHDYHIIPAHNSQDVRSDAEKEEEKAKVGLDHDYCNSNDNENNHDKNGNDDKNSADSKYLTKLKIKRRSKDEGSRSSSSESSSDSDSSCSCGSNCSCSSGSSSSTSSNDSDSDSREKRKKKVLKNTKPDIADVDVSQDIDISVHDLSNEKTIRESDLETEETETDEDFYDYNPAREANKVLSEKRTQLLANLNGANAIVKPPPAPTEKPQVPRKKLKVKKKIRSQSRATTKPKTARNKSQKSPTSGNDVPESAKAKPRSGTKVKANGISCTPTQPQENVQSSNEGEGSRPKRKRIPLKFYGFSSDDESETTTASKKREKTEQNTTTPATPVTPVPTLTVVTTESNTSNQKSSTSWKVEKSENVQQRVNPIKIRTSHSFKQGNYFGRSNKKSEFFQIKKPEKPTVSVSVSGSGSGSASASASTTAPVPSTSGMAGSSAGQKGEKLYCFCQCPYDEVSEMIACDAEDCVIEWFHFECVGIMVPPKGSWYCPDCRKKLAAENEFLSPNNND